jgi:methylmalonyl-CoA/ethylmalonyl-CoA epimerase
MDEIKPLHCGISVPDMDASIAWYREMLDFTVKTDRYMSALKARVVIIDNGSFNIELFQVEDVAPLPEERRTPNLDIGTCGTKHIAFSVKDIRKFLNRLKERKVDIAMDVFPVGKNLAAFIRDNAGNLLEFIQLPDD